MEGGETPEAPQATPAQTGGEVPVLAEQEKTNKALEVARKLTAGDASPDTRNPEQVAVDWFERIIETQERYYALLEQKAATDPNQLDEFERNALERHKQAKETAANLKVSYSDYPKNMSKSIEQGLWRGKKE